MPEPKIIGFIKEGDYWEPTTDPEDIVQAEHPCVIVDSVEEGIEVINRLHNPYGENFSVAGETGWSYGSDKYRIQHFKEPVLSDRLSFFEALEVIKAADGEPVHIESYSQKNRWEKEIHGKEWFDFDLIAGYMSFTYDPKKAEQKRIYRKRKRPHLNQSGRDYGRKHFIKVWEIHDLNRDLQSSFRKNSWMHYGFDDSHLSISVRAHNDDKHTKLQLCADILIHIEGFNKWFGQYSYRRVESFQVFKLNWKGKKPKTAKYTGVTQDFFDFMQEEIKARKPRNIGKFKGKKVIRNDKSYDV